MNIRWLEDFISLAETGNFTRSSRLRFATQSAFSRRIRALEEWLGTELFDRMNQPVTLTPAGVAFRAGAQDMLKTLEQARRLAQAAQKGEDTTIRLGVTHGLFVNFVLPWLRATRAAIGGFEPRLERRSHAGCLSMLESGELEFAVTHIDPEGAGGIDATADRARYVDTDVLVPVSAPDAGGRPRHSLCDADERDNVLLPYREGSAFHPAVDRKLHAGETRVRCRRGTSDGHADVLRSMTLEGYGLSWQPYRDVKTYLSSGRLVRAADRTWDIELYIALLRRPQALSQKGELLWRYAGTRPLQRAGRLELARAV